MKLAAPLLLTFTVACASGARQSAMIPEQIDVVRGHPHSVRIATAGGRETQWWWSSQISDEAFSSALFESLSGARLFAAVLREGEADYLLDVFIVDVRQPIVGFDMTVSVVANWTLRLLATDEIVFDELIATPYEATVDRAFSGVERLQLANEGAARANIAEGIRRLSELDLSARAAEEP